MKGIVLSFGLPRRRRVHLPDIKKVFKRYGVMILFGTLLLTGLALGIICARFADSQTLRSLDFLFTTNLDARLSQSALGTFCACFASDFIFLICIYLLGLTSWGIPFLFLIVCFSKKLTGKLLRLVYTIMKAIRFIKNPTGKIRKVARELNMFHKSNKMLMDNKKRLIIIFFLVLIQSMFILSVPYFIYLAFGMPKIAASHGMPVGNPFDFICIQSFVLFTSNLVPLPGASGGAELAFTMYFGKYFAIGNIRKIKPAILLWRFITYSRKKKAKRNLKSKKLK